MSAERSLREALARVTREADALREERQHHRRLARAYLATRPGASPITSANAVAHFRASKRAQEIVDELVALLAKDGDA